jgi:hypothetical protein
MEVQEKAGRLEVQLIAERDANFSAKMKDRFSKHDAMLEAKRSIDRCASALFVFLVCLKRIYF